MYAALARVYGDNPHLNVLHVLGDHLEVIWGGLIAFAVVVLLTPAVGGMARLLGVVDRPGDGRRAHTRTVPRLGGLALFFGIFVPALAFLDLTRNMRGLLLGAAVDRELNEHGFIVPGLGDAGDRLYGTK